MNRRSEPNPDHTAFYVSAIDAGKPRIAAGPYASHQAALDRVQAVRNHIVERMPECHFWHWGTCSAQEPLDIRVPLGAF